MSDKAQNNEKIKAFASSAVVQIEAIKLPQDNQSVKHVINIDMAPVNNQKADWGRKLTVQLSEDEAPIYACVLLGLLPRCEFKRQGKGIFIERQQGKIFYKGSAGMGNFFLVGVPIGKTFNMSNFVLRQLAVQTNTQNETFLLASLRGCASLYRSLI